MGGEIKLIDMSFYEPYKSMGDVMVTAFVYIMFFWRVFSRLPDIISGAGMVEIYSQKISRYEPKEK